MKILKCWKWNNFPPNWPKSRGVEKLPRKNWRVPEDKRKPFNNNDVTQTVDMQTIESDEIRIFTDNKCKKERQIYITQFECEVLLL